MNTRKFDEEYINLKHDKSEINVHQLSIPVFIDCEFICSATETSYRIVSPYFIFHIYIIRFSGRCHI